MNNVICLGFNDSLKGYGFRKEYDHWVMNDQNRYEIGRMYAAQIKSFQTIAPISEDEMGYDVPERILMILRDFNIRIY